ncbi:MAG TPA: M43 family zinc metalloprotease [Saprospiraceae bacterium]|nr:M43 family zinc metalloprotease [Saprospiraceae bacterium]HMQ82343.1 M43 family zinc metalloprotease [Saprospiraceae bacterium]
MSKKDRHYWPVLAIVLSFLLPACLPPGGSRYLRVDEVQRVPASFENAKSPCNEWESYVPDTLHPEHTPMRYVRINMHWMNTRDTAYDLKGHDMVRYTKNMVYAANYDLSKNKKMYLPHGNDTPALPIGVRLLLTPRPDDTTDDGIYFHYDDSLYYYVHKGKNRNLHKREVINQYGVQLDTVLNIFIMPHHPDSVDSPTYKAYGVGVALGNAVKISGVYDNHTKYDDYWSHRGVINHEVGHIYSLSHTWASNDGCDDTPRHPQDCYVKGQSAHCDTSVSNNVMDYVAEQNSWSPCQIARVHRKMTDLGSKTRNYLLPTWCELTDSLSISIRDTVEWPCHKDLNGHLTIASGGQLTIHCRLSMPPGAVIRVEPGGKLILQSSAWLHNACGEEWEGIQIGKKGSKSGEVVFIGAPKLEDMRHPLDE